MIGGMEIDVVQWIILFFGTAAAGWVDAVIGGGGLILIPMLLAVLPGLAPAAAIIDHHYEILHVFGQFSC